MARVGAAAAGCALLALATVACSEEDRAKVGDIVSSATAAAASKMGEVKDGVNATGDVKAGPTAKDGDRTTAEVTATNPQDRKADYTILVNFRDGDGKLLDTVVLNIDGVDPGRSGTGTARSNRTLSGETTAEIGQALRH
ncbi:hypothetical protein J7E93_30655 [Streptomyces sp. ISL-36]|nr:hypothetical protein [Streptomyces sp. ISL-36]MBT2444379.1 hypothetical protein [Streptomyces sp. ISL-36]